MECYRSLDNARGARAQAPRRVATVGFFDGLHGGHRLLLRELKAWARETGAEHAVVTFECHPQHVLTGRGPLQVLSAEHKLLLLAREGIAAALLLPFDRELAQWPAERFVKDAIVGAMNASGLLMGFDSALGHARRGTFTYLKEREPALGLEVRQAGVWQLDGERVSSTLVREALLAADLRRLERLLGRRFSLLGRVVRGDGRGRDLGFPTANLDLLGGAHPPPGVYFAEASLLGPSLDACLADPLTAGAHRLGAVVNIGTRPTFHDRGAVSSAVEAHLVGWDGDLYGQYVEVFFLARHRDEQKFPSVHALTRRIRQDIEDFERFRATQ